MNNVWRIISTFLKDMQYRHHIYRIFLYCRSQTWGKEEEIVELRKGKLRNTFARAAQIHSLHITTTNNNIFHSSDTFRGSKRSKLFSQ